MSSVESWRELPDGDIEFTMRRLRRRLGNIRLPPELHQHLDFCRIPITGYSGIPPRVSPRRRNHGERPQRPRCPQVRSGRLAQEGFLIPAPDAPWIQCYILDISENGACLDVGDLAVPKMFGLSLTAGGEVLRVCTLIWRRGEMVGVQFISARELRKGAAPADAPDAASKKAHA